MKYKKILFFNLLFVCALILALTLEGTALVDAKGLTKPVFDSPINKDDDSGPPPANEKGEVDPENLNADIAVRDPETPGFHVFFLDGAIDEAVKVKFFSTGVPEDVSPLPNAFPVPASIIPTSDNSPYFFFAVWRRAVEGGAVTQFNQPILINVPYHDLNLSGDQENQLRIWMYSPATQSWIKLGGQVDTFNNVVTGILMSMSPYQPDGNTLFALGFDDPSPLNQTVDEFGTTTISTPTRDDFKLFVPAGSVVVGSHFEMTNLLSVPNTGSLELIVQPIYVAAYHIKYNSWAVPEKYAMARLAKPVKIEFSTSDFQDQGLDSDAVTLVMFVDGQWVNVEDLGYTITRSGNTISVETDALGIFGLARIMP